MTGESMSYEECELWDWQIVTKQQWKTVALKN